MAEMFEILILGLEVVNEDTQLGLEVRWNKTKIQASNSKYLVTK